MVWIHDREGGKAAWSGYTIGEGGKAAWSGYTIGEGGKAAWSGYTIGRGARLHCLNCTGHIVQSLICIRHIRSKSEQLHPTYKVYVDLYFPIYLTMPKNMSSHMCWVGND